MKKISYIVLLLISMLLFCSNTFAKKTIHGVEIIESETPNDNTLKLYCSYYSGDYIIIDRASLDENGNIEFGVGDFDLFQEASNENLHKYHFMYDEGNFDCPVYIVKERATGKVINFSNEPNPDERDKYYYNLDTSKSTCEGKCNGSQTSTEEEIWECVYTGPSGKLTIKKEKGTYIIYYPNGKYKYADLSTYLSSSCGDIFYNTRTQKFMYANYDYFQYIGTHNNYDPTQNNFICGDDYESIEYFCSGECNYPNNANIDCKKTNEIIEGNFAPICKNNDAKKVFRFIGYMLWVVKLLIPLLLIALGTIDFVKAMTSSDTEAIAKSTKSLITRIIAGVIIFLIPTIIDFAFSLVNKKGISFKDCQTCISSPSKCKISKD